MNGNGVAWLLTGLIAGGIIAYVVVSRSICVFGHCAVF